MRNFIVAILVSALTVGPQAFAEKDPYELGHGTRERGLFLPQLLTLVLPGVDQWWEGQEDYGAAYTGMAGVGYLYAVATKDVTDTRHFQLGQQIILAAGGYSAFHSFRTAVTTYHHGEFDFLSQTETPGDLLFSPLRVDYLIRPSTLLPIGIVVILAAIGTQSPGFDPSNFTLDDGLFAGGQSYLAGTWEEAAFRGWLMPLFMHYSHSPIMSCAVSSLIFAAAHYRPNKPLPVIPLILGAYLGAVSIRNDWTLSESIFIHSWWDAALLSVYYSITTQAPAVHLPLIQLTF